MSDVTDWWRTQIIDMEPGKISLRGTPIQSLIGQVSFPDMIYLMVIGRLPTPGQSAVLEAALVAAVDHGPQAPSIAAARMAATCGVDLNNVMATGVNMLGDVHGGAGQQALTLYTRIAKSPAPLEQAISTEVDRFRIEYGKHVAGFGHRYHKPTDPRSAPLMEVLRANGNDSGVDARYAEIAEGVQGYLLESTGHALAINIDGATAALYGAIGVAPELARGLFCLSRSVGVLAHGWEQMQQGGRNKGPTPPAYRWRYDEPLDARDK